MKLFDSHFHIIDYDFLAKENNGYMPPSFKVNDYLNYTQQLNVVGGAIVSGSFQGFDQDYLISALRVNLLG